MIKSGITIDNIILYLILVYFPIILFLIYILSLNIII